jgi:hypothetical protein
LTAFTQGFWVQGDVLFLYPAAAFSAQASIQLVYPSAPLALCDDTGVPPPGAASAAQVGAVNASSGLITLVNVNPSSFTVGSDVNFVSGNPQFATNAYSTITATTGLTITVAAAALTDSYGRPTVNPGDWVANAGYSPFLQLPVEARNMVTEAAIVKALRAMNDDGAAVAKASYDEMERAGLKLFAARVDDAPKTISTYGRGVGAIRRFRGWMR